MSGDTRGAVDGWLAGGFLRSCGGSGSVQNAESTPAVTTATMTRVEVRSFRNERSPRPVWGARSVSSPDKWLAMREGVG